MPFTVSHVAAVLPFRRWLRPERMLPAAVIGAMVPDFGLFLPFWVPRYETHGRLALLTFCLPVGLASWLLFETIVRPAWLDLAPDSWWLQWRQRGALPWGSVRTWVLGAASVLGGALTHLAWDGFTHEGARGVEMLPLLDSLAWQVNGHPMHLYRLLQHLSSLIGLALVAWVIWRWQWRLPPAVGVPRRTLGSVERGCWLGACLLIPAAATLAAAWLSLRDTEPLYASGASLARVAQAGMGAAGATLLAVSLLVRWRARRGC
jgi:hypothetical protein